tara:strand:- start:7690 stop:8907 length:1218 start_codon:yes stop_codon:yes gene_type:complete
MKLIAPHTILDVPIVLPASKSISNRLLIIKSLSDEGVITNLSTAQDTQILAKLLREMPATFNVGHAGTAFRFLTAYLAITHGTHILTGSSRMKQRPIGILVDALRKLGAEITYIEKEGFPPLKITGKPLDGGLIEIESGTSSQYISALMLIAPKLKNGLKIILSGDVVSKPYLEMTAQLMRQCGVSVNYDSDIITIPNSSYHFSLIKVEYDWSAVAFWYEMVVFGRLAHLYIQGLKLNSLQGDAKVVSLFETIGVKSEFDENGLHLSYVKSDLNQNKTLDFKETPDLVQPFLATIGFLNAKKELTGTHTLQFKETDRLKAMKNELAKFGIQIKGDHNSVELVSGWDGVKRSCVNINTYQDHRMAMAFAAFSLCTDELEIENPDVVEKSYPNFWNELEKLGFTMVS